MTQKKSVIQMAISLFLTTFFSAVIFLPLAFYILRNEEFLTKKFRTIVFGGSFWVVVAILDFAILFLIDLVLGNFKIAESSSMSAYRFTQVNHRSVLFWYLFVATIINEVARFLGTINEKYIDRGIEGTLFFGLGWGISEFITRFLFFFSLDQIIYTVLILFYVVLVNMALSTLLLRAEENTKFVMFSSFLKFFIEVSFFGVFGYNMDLSEGFYKIGVVVFFLLSLVVLSTISKKRSVEEKAVPN